MVNDTSDRPRLTPKGARTRARIVEEAAALIHERGVAGTTLEDVKVAAEGSRSQMYHYFAHTARHPPRGTPTRPGTTEFASLRNCGRYPPRPCHPDLSPYSAKPRVLPVIHAPRQPALRAPSQHDSRQTRPSARRQG